MTIVCFYRDESHFVEIPDRSLKDYLGYISTWSGFRTYSKTNDGEKLLQDFARRYALIVLLTVILTQKAQFFTLNPRLT